MALKDYPDWVLKHKKPNTEIRFLNNKYYLYSYSYKDVNGKKKKVTESYLGSITIEGFTPRTPKNTVFLVKEYYSTLYTFTVLNSIIISIKNKHVNLYKSYIGNALFDLLFSSNINKWNNSFLSFLFTNNSENLDQSEVLRIKNMMNYHINKSDLNLNNLSINLYDLYIVITKNDFIISSISNESKSFINNNNLNLEVSLWQKLINL